MEVEILVEFKENICESQTILYLMVTNQVIRENVELLDRINTDIINLS